MAERKFCRREPSCLRTEGHAGKCRRSPDLRISEIDWLDISLLILLLVIIVAALSWAVS